MSDILLQTLNNADIDWLVTSGQRLRLSAGDVLMKPGRSLETLYVLLEGTLTVQSPGAAESQLSRGDMVGEGSLFDIEPVVSVVASSEAIALAVPKVALWDKLRQDAAFASHFYQALALIMSEQIRHLFEASTLLRYQSGHMVKEALFVFGELQDSDIDWMTSAGQVTKLAADRVLLNAGRPVDALYTLLDGQLAIAATENPCDPFSTCSDGLAEKAAEQDFKPVAYLARGGLPGIISFLDFRPLPVRISAVRESLMLTIPRREVSIKLQEDLGFAARFYRVIAAQTASLLTAVVSNDTDAGLNDELDVDALQRVSQGAAKFDWMLKHLGISGGISNSIGSVGGVSQ